MTDPEILERLREILQDTFGIDPASVQPETHLFQDLDLDSIDAVDLAIKVQELTGKRIKPDEFKAVRLVSDVVLAIRGLIAS